MHDSAEGSQGLPESWATWEEGQRLSPAAHKARRGDASVTVTALPMSTEHIRGSAVSTAREPCSGNTAPMVQWASSEHPKASLSRHVTNPPHGCHRATQKDGRGPTCP